VVGSSGKLSGGHRRRCRCTAKMSFPFALISVSSSSSYLAVRSRRQPIRRPRRFRSPWTYRQSSWTC